MENHYSSISGEKIIVLGGSSGLGFAAAKVAAAEGAIVTIVSSNQLRIDKALKELPTGSTGFAIDLGKEINIKSFFDATDSFDHLVYTAAENLTLNIVSDIDLEQARQFFNLRYWVPLPRLNMVLLI